VSARYEFHEIANIFPMMDGAEMAALVDDIRANGLREPIWLYENKILDGRNRYTACLDASVEPTLNVYADGDPVSFVISLNLRRRHLDTSQRAMVAAKLATLKQGARTDLAQICAKSQDEAAEALNVSRRSVQHAAEVHEHGVPELVGAVERGEVAVSTAARVAELSQEEQREAVAGGKSGIQAALATEPFIKTILGQPEATDAAAVESERQRAALGAAWKGAGQKARESFLADIERPAVSAAATPGEYAPIVDLYALGDCLPHESETDHDKVGWHHSVDEMASIAAELCDRMISVANRAHAEIIAGIFRLPIELLPLTRGHIADAIAEAKLTKKELRQLRVSPELLEYWTRNPGHGLDLSMMHDDRRLLERIGIMQNDTAHVKIIRPDDVMGRTGIRSHQHLRKLVLAGQFPAPIQLGPKSIGFVENEVLTWIEQRMAARPVRALPAIEAAAWRIGALAVAA
jgi:predicted DNA-binding transcriptional regulator AlpA